MFSLLVAIPDFSLIVRSRVSNKLIWTVLFSTLHIRETPTKNGLKNVLVQVLYLPSAFSASLCMHQTELSICFQDVSLKYYFRPYSIFFQKNVHIACNGRKYTNISNASQLATIKYIDLLVLNVTVSLCFFPLGLAEIIH